jgi:exopolysaccharide biosynthesis operon protein EpsL
MFSPLQIDMTDIRMSAPFFRPAAAPRACTGAFLLGLVAALASLPARAELSDTIHPFAGVSYNYDDNLFRLPDAQPGDTMQRSDSSKQLVLGVQFERPVGRQRFVADAKVSKVSFNHYDQLNYDGKDLDATWFWELGNHLKGTVGATYAQTLTPFNDFHSTERNLRVERDEFFEGKWLFHPHWRINGRVEAHKFEYDLSSQKFQNRKEDTSELGFDYIASSGSTLGMVARRIKGNYPNPLSFGDFVFNPAYVQEEIKVNAFWLVTGLSQLEFHGGRVRRTHESASGRDASGTNGRLVGSWSPTPLVKLSLSTWREFAPFEGTAAAYGLGRGNSVKASWSPLDRVSVEAKVQQVKRDFSYALASAGFQDSSRNGSVGLTYAPREHISLSASVFHDSRQVESRFGTAYRANGASLSANLQF